MASPRAQTKTITCTLTEAESRELARMQAELAQPPSFFLMIGVRASASRYAQEMRRQRRREGPQED